MSELLHFEFAFRYPDNSEGIQLPVTLVLVITQIFSRNVRWVFSPRMRAAA